MLNFSSMKWTGELVEVLISTTSLVVFTFFDFLDFLLCTFYKFFDALLEENATPCYCEKNRGKQGGTGNDGGDGGEEHISETLYKRKNIFRDLGILKWSKKRQNSIEEGGVFKVVKSRWSDCNCESCMSWQQSGDHKLHVVVMEPSKGLAAAEQNCMEKQVENIIFLHGFLSSSSFWVEAVFPNITESGKQNYRLFAVDLLGFGKSPKPWDCLYKLTDHVKMVEQSVINPFDLKSFHIVAHSMGCIIALGLASKYLKSVKSITLVAPPYFSSSIENASLTALNRLADRRLWPPLLFGSSVMSWYEHLGRSICFIICRNHRRWEWILKLLLRRRDLPFAVMDLTRHTHHSAWHTMHNVICGGAKLMDGYLETIKESGVMLTVIQGDKDRVTPLECSHNLKMKMPLADVHIISNADHSTVIFGRQRQFTRDLEHIWLSTSRKASLQEVVI